MKRLLLLGATGQVGRELARTLAPLAELVVATRSAFDLTREESMREAIRRVRPDVIVNAAAYTAVDQAEHDAATAMLVNGHAPGIMAEEAARLDALLVHYSTDYVFDGAKATPYHEEDQPNPLSVYGRSKLAGEQAIRGTDCRHLIFRTSWVYGLHGKNFLLTIERLAGSRDEIKVVDDQIGAPTWSRMIAEATALALRSEAPNGIYHLTCGGATSWHGFAAAILAAMNWPGRLVAIPTSDYPTPAHRPANSRLDNHKLARTFGLQLPDWQTALALCLADRPTP